jgi:hypothetical protein
LNSRIISSNTKKAISFLVEQYNETHGFKTQSDPKRLGNPKKLDQDDVQQLFKDVLGASNIVIYKPKTGPNPSSKFNMFEFDTNDFGLVRIILSGGGNEGEKYEQEFTYKAIQSAGKPLNDIPKDIQTLYYTLNIDSKNLSSSDIQFAGTQDTKRNLSINGAENIGKTISDLTINYNNTEYFISLKNKSGSGLYSGKNIPFIYDYNDNVIYDHSKRNLVPSIDYLFNIFNIDGELLAQGINNYIHQKGKINDWCNVDIDNNGFKNLLASSFGYGYYYVKEKTKNNIEVTPILTKQDALNAVGEIQSTQIKYPGPTTKQLTIKTLTYSPLFGNSQYEVHIRNTRGNVLPLSLRISKK